MNISAATKSNGIASHTFYQSNSIRVSPRHYFAALFLTTFLSGFLIYLEKDWAGAILFFTGWLSFPILARTDRIIFDGKKLTRTGFVPRLWARINNFRFQLRISAVEQVETRALRPQKHGKNVFCRFQTTVRGRGISMTFASGEKGYWQMAQAIFSSLPKNMLDNHSLEILDYSAAPNKTLLKADLAQIPPVEILEKSLDEFLNLKKHPRQKNEVKLTGESEKNEAEDLRRLANELRLSGYFLQSLEAFRRALLLTPKNARLLYDFARCLHSSADFRQNRKLARKAFAVLRLAEKGERNDDEILARLGETYFEYGDWRRAEAIFHKSIETASDNFRALRGLAEIALRQGKIAHVIHHFSNAHRIAETPALKRWTKNEGKYFAKLNADEEYMELEINRVKMLDGLEQAQRTCLTIIFCGCPLIIFGVAVEDNLIANIGWAISLIALFIWILMIVARHLLAARMPPDFEDED